MKRLLFFLTLLMSLICTSNTNAQHVTFVDDNKNRGYVNRPYLRYEAESSKCVTDGIILSPSFDQRTLQSEASNQSAVNLINIGSYVQWNNSATADGMTIRFSIPDNSIGTGTQGTLALFVNDIFVQNIILDSYWAWQYILKYGTKYPDNTPNTTSKFPRMRFDEIRVKLTKKIPVNARIKLVKVDNEGIPYTIDFMELEDIPKPITFESIQDTNKVMYTPDAGSLVSFIGANLGKTIFIPEGKYNVDKRIYINGDNTKLLGAGMWHTELFFTASSDDRGTYSHRGIEANGNNIVIQDLFLNTINNKRYYNNNSAYQVGKGLMGSFGTNSTIKNIWIEHFECGGWIEGANNLLIQNSRFRNNYADGMNLANGCINSILENSSFRNNGDDDMASWSRASGLCVNNTYRYCTSENNWRASAIGFFGGKQNKAYNCVVIDPMEAGLRITSDFPGVPYSSDGFTEFHNISVYKGGVANGTMGVYGDLWGNQQGAIHVVSTTQYDVQNIKFSNIDLIDSKNNAVFIGCSSYNIRNLILSSINIDGTGNYGLFFNNPKGNGKYCDITYSNIGNPNNTNTPSDSFIFIEDCGAAVGNLLTDQLNAVGVNGKIFISGIVNTPFSVYNSLGMSILKSHFKTNPMEVNMNTGLYIIRWNEQNFSKKVWVN
ncbi:MAG: hypothetical protein GX361_01500 [Bacteroidales bacterium]|nr:hypothetical protein [Bacteroidales bacterium]